MFARLVYLASLRDPISGRYEHDDLGSAYGGEETDRVLRQAHARVLQAWLCLKLPQQRAEVDLYLAGFGEDRHRRVEAWLRQAWYRGLLPASAEAVECLLYRTDLETLLELLRSECGVAARQRPHRLCSREVLLVPQEAGVYLFSRDGKSPHYVGRAERDLGQRIAEAARSGRYTHFWFESAGSPQEAFLNQCRSYHWYNPPDNLTHPAVPFGENWRCPVPGCRWAKELCSASLRPERETRY